MPRSSRFQRDRVAKLFGNKTKLIEKPSETEKLYMKPYSTPVGKDKYPPAIQQPHTQQKTGLKLQTQLPVYTPIKPQSHPQPMSAPSHLLDPQPTFKFRNSSYIHMVKCHKPINNPMSRVQQIEKTSFRCYNDEEIFGKEEMINFLKQNWDNDHDTPEEQVKYDVNRGVRRLQEQIQRVKHMKQYQANDQGELGQNDQKFGEINQNSNSRGFNQSIGNTPPRYVKRYHR